MPILKRAYTIKADGTEEELNHQPSLSEAQKIVDGYVEFVRCPTTPVKVLVVNEDGIPRRLPFNERASLLYGRGKIVGDVIVLEGWKTVKS